MQIGLAYDLKPVEPPPPGAPDDLYDEFDSPATIEALERVLTGLGHQVSRLGNGRPLIESLLRERPDLVFNFAEGVGVSRSREARVPAVCEMLDIPYTGSDPLALSVSLDKDLTRRIVASEGVRIPKGFLYKPTEHGSEPANRKTLKARTAELSWPLIAKPAFEGSSKGVRESCLIETDQHLEDRVLHLARLYQQPILLEEFIDGDEVTVGIVGNHPPSVLAIMKIVPRVPETRFVYTLEKKRDSERFVHYECPARFPERVTTAIVSAALRVFNTLGLRDVARVDFRVRKDTAYFLEVNPLPGLNPITSDLPIMARMLGIEYPELIRRILQAACMRSKLSCDRQK